MLRGILDVGHLPRSLALARLRETEKTRWKVNHAWNQAMATLFERANSSKEAEKCPEKFTVSAVVVMISAVSPLNLKLRFTLQKSFTLERGSTIRRKEYARLLFSLSIQPAFFSC